MFYSTQNQTFHTLPCLQNIYIESIQCLSLISLPAVLFELEHNIQIIKYHSVISFCDACKYEIYRISSFCILSGIILVYLNFLQRF